MLDYAQYDALGLAELVARGEVSPSELVEAAIARIERHNPTLNAVVTDMFEEARRVAAGPLPEGPFKGVPFLLKDLETVVKGVPMSMGSRACAGYIPGQDSEMALRLRRSGLVFVGKTNCPEFGLMGVTEPELWGPTRNPWNPEHTPGGSSGGSAAAVAARFVPFASAGDGGGSIRIPASCCGLVGLKPTRGRVPLGPFNGELWSGAVVSHALTRTVRDCAAMLDVLAGADVGAPYEIPPPERPFLEEIGREPGSLRIAYTTQSPLGAPVNAACREAVEQTAKLLESLGHEVAEDAPDYDGHLLAECYVTMYQGEVDASLRKLEKVLGRRIRPGDVEPATWALRVMGRKLTAGDFAFYKSHWNEPTRAVGRFFEEYDLFLTPTLAAPPLRVGELAMPGFERVGLKIINRLGLSGLLKRKIKVESLKNLAKMPFTQLANLTGVPAISLPLHRVGDLPIGVQFMARFGAETTLLRLAAQLETTDRWQKGEPRMVAAEAGATAVSEERISS
ncbi:Amidase [Sulfidibacter corallicola]|uniref:Amidase n=1 Tax=Sulfidibacter corallicola TaxID=2818388 RepID=A0A8A4TIF1_SULCO|nr:amidase [Sulfidibacter corallicola]QTD48964.1 amidase [Sulfidibacter corallicola]